jgi:hypothetical protein
MSRYKLGDLTIKNWNSWDRVPRVEAIATAIIEYFAIESAVAQFLVTAAVYVGTAMVTSAVLSGLAPKPDFGSASGSSGLLTNTRNSTGSAEVVYGQIRKGGTVSFIETTGGNDKVLHQIIVLAAHEVEEIGDIYLNDEVVTMSNETVTSSPYVQTRGDNVNGYTTYYNAKIYKHLGNQTSATDTFANSTSSLSNTLHSETSVPASFIGKGMAYLYCRFVYDQESFSTGLPAVTAVVKGKKVVKTTNGVEASPVFTSNSAWVIRDLLTSSYGLNDDQIDYVSFEAAADVCDDGSVLSDGSAQYQVNGVVDLSQPVGDVLTDLVASCGGSLFWGGGYWKLYAGEFVTPTKTLTLDDLRSSISLQTKNSMRDNFNRVSGTFIDADGDWISADYPPVESSTFLSDDNGIPATMDLPLPYTTNALAAQRLAKQMLFRSREQISLSADFGLSALDVEIGDFIKFRNERYGWGEGSEKIFEVVGWRLNPDVDNGDLRINLTLRESSEAAFGFSAADEQTIISNNTTLLKYYDVPNIGVTVSQEYREVNENVVNVLVVQVTSSEIERLDSVILKYKKTSDTSYRSVGQTILVSEGDDAARFEIVGIDTPNIDQSAINYTVAVTPVNGLGFKGSTVATTFNVTADTTPPAAPSSLSHNLSGGTAFFNWPSVSDLDLSHYKLYYSSNSSANFGDASVLQKVEKIARPATSITQPALAGKFFISAVDKTGNESTSAASTIITPSELPSLGQSDTDTEDPTFSGSKSNLTVSSGSLFMTSYSASGSTGTYDFDHSGNGYFDVGTSRTVRLSSTITVSRKHEDAVGGEVNWDDIPQNWDTWPDNWDTWTNEDADFADYAVQIQARAADTTGGLSSATFVDAGGEIVGRYIEFRAILSNTNAKISPNITALSATVEY